MDKNSTIIYVFDNTEYESWHVTDVHSLFLHPDIKEMLQALKGIKLEPRKETIKDILDFARNY